MGKQISGAQTPFKDKDGNVIKVHDYVKDSEGNRYYVNSYCQAVPEGGDAPAVELERLIETSEVSVMSIEEVLDMNPQVERRRRGGRRRKEDSGYQPAEQAKVEAEARKALEEAKAAAKAAAAEAARTAREGELHPVTEQMILCVISDDALANELRRRGYTLCAVRPALIEL